jgi:hypothetical protein
MTVPGSARVKTQNRAAEIVSRLEDISIRASGRIAVSSASGRTWPAKSQVRVHPCTYAAAEFSHGLDKFRPSPERKALVSERIKPGLGGSAGINTEPSLSFCCRMRSTLIMKIGSSQRIADSAVLMSDSLRVATAGRHVAACPLELGWLIRSCRRAGLLADFGLGTHN